MSVSDDVCVSLIHEVAAAHWDAIPLSERGWRARWFLMVWAMTGHQGMAWTSALSTERDECELWRDLVRGTPDEMIVWRVKNRLDASAHGADAVS